MLSPKGRCGLPRKSPRFSINEQSCGSLEAWTSRNRVAGGPGEKTWSKEGAAQAIALPKNVPNAS
jgi:hypothetical protein